MKHWQKWYLAPLLYTCLAAFTSFAEDQSQKGFRVPATPATAFTVRGPTEFKALVRSLGKDRYRAKLEIPDFLQAFVKVGELATVQLPFANRPKLNAQIRKGENGLEAAFAFPHSAINSMKVSVQVPLQRASLHLVPLESVFSPTGEEQFVFVVREGRTQLLKLEIWKLYKGQLLASADFQQGDQIVTAKLNELTNNLKVEVFP
jgi:hypothetical protein